MIVCVVCHHEELDGELFCTECGARLMLEGETATTAFMSTGRARQAPAQPPPRSGLMRLQPGQVALVITGAPEPVILEGRSEYVLGREGHEQVTPHLNLNPYGAREMGVSRVHAALRHDQNQLLLIDLGSTNGTRLNGTRLEAHRPARLSNGDEVRLGRLTFRVNFVPQ